MNNMSGVDRICLQVFSKISATISHEIKNTLSIINENAGLLDDLVGMADEESGVQPQRVQAAASTIMKQVVRSNTIMKNLNRFAHSCDTLTSKADLYETLSLVAALTTRQAAMKKIYVTVSNTAGVEIYTNLLHLESLLIMMLLRLYGCSTEGRSLSINTIVEEEKVEIRFEIDGEKGILLHDFPNENERALAQMLEAAWANEDGLLSLILPLAITDEKFGLG